MVSTKLFRNVISLHSIKGLNYECPFIYKQHAKECPWKYLLGFTHKIQASVATNFPNTFHPPTPPLAAKVVPLNRP